MFSPYAAIISSSCTSLPLVGWFLPDQLLSIQVWTHDVHADALDPTAVPQLVAAAAAMLPAETTDLASQVTLVGQNPTLEEGCVVGSEQHLPAGALAIVLHRRQVQATHSVKGCASRNQGEAAAAEALSVAHVVLTCLVRAHIQGFYTGLGLRSW
jgi:hypothetical protein